jgi:predicted metal-dependent hydrolase
MTELVVRRLLIDLEQPVARHWCGGDAFLTAWFNALSMSFPSGEQFFIDAVRAGVATLPAPEQAAWGEALRGFVGQEATHRHVHALYNRQLAQQGLRNHWEARALRRMAQMNGVNPLHHVALTAAVEHLTAILSAQLLAQPLWLARADPRLAALWRWHASEECEHRAVAFDLYRAMGGNEAWRRRWMRRATLLFVTDVLRQTASNLWHHRALHLPSTWVSAARCLLGPRGLLRTLWRPWKDWFAPGFHPLQHSGAAGQQWLAEHAALAPPVGSGAG